MTTSHMKGQCVCVCEGGKCMPVCQTRQTKPLPSPPTHPFLPRLKTSTAMSAAGRAFFSVSGLARWLVAPKWTISSVDFMFFNLLSFSQLRNSCSPVGGRGNREGAPKNALSFRPSLCQHLLAFSLRPAAIHFVWFKGFACQIWRYLFFFCYTHANKYTQAHTQWHTSTSLTLGTCLPKCFAC